MNQEIFCPPLLPSASAQELTIPAARLVDTIQALEQGIQTGLVEITASLQRRYVLLLVRGQMVNLYVCQPSLRRVPVGEGLAKIARNLPKSERVQIRSLSLTPHAIRLLKILIEGNHIQEQRVIATTEIESLLEGLQSGTMPVLLHFEWPHAESLVLIPERSSPPLNIIFAASNQLLNSAGGVMALLAWHEAKCKVTALNSEKPTAAWEEYGLHFGFVWFIDYLFARIEQLAGHFLVENIAHEINFTAVAHGWNVSVSPDSATDQSIFASPEEAADVYRRLITVALEKSQVVLSADALALMIREGLSRMQPAYRRVFQKYIHLEVHTLKVALPSVRISAPLNVAKDDHFRP